MNASSRVLAQVHYTLTYGGQAAVSIMLGAKKGRTFMGSALFDLAGRRALVTGSSQGIGLVLARGLAEAGATVILNGRDPEKLARSVAALKADGLAACGCAFD